MSIWEGLQIVLTIFEVGMCIWICDVVVYDGEVLKENKACKIMGMVVLLIIVISNRWNAFFSWPILLFEIGCTWLILIFRKRDSRTLCFICVFDYYLLESLLDLAVAFWGIGYLDAEFWAKLYYKVEVEKIFIYFLSRAIVFGICFVICTYKKKKYFNIENYRGVLFSVGVVGTIWGWMFLTVLVDYANDTSQMNSFFIISCLLILLLFMAIELKSSYIKAQSKMIRMKNELLEQNYKNLQNLYMSNQYIFHDFKHHVVLLRNYLDRHEYEKAVQYLGEFAEPVEKLSNYIHTGCDVLDLVFNIKEDEAKQKGIRYQVEVDGEFKTNINENDLGNIFFNLLDNAIEACEKIKGQDKWIRVLIKRKNQIYIIKIENSIRFPVLVKDGEYLTEKDNRECHGIGMKSVESCVKHYGGNVRWSHTEDVFTVVITFFENGL